MTKPDVLLYEKEAWASGFLRLAGIDEAGRGPLAGPVVAAAVIFNPDYIRAELESTYGRLTDSKAMTEARREEYFALLTASEFVEVGVGIVDAAEIDRINILKATHKAMALAAGQLKPVFALVDGLPVKGLPFDSKSIVKGGCAEHFHFRRQHYRKGHPRPHHDRARCAVSGIRLCRPQGIWDEAAS